MVCCWTVGPRGRGRYVRGIGIYIGIPAQRYGVVRETPLIFTFRFTYYNCRAVYGVAHFDYGGVSVVVW